MKRLERLKIRLTKYQQAEDAILTGQQYRMGDVELTRANLKDVQTMITQLENAIDKLENAKTRSRIRFAVPIDDTSQLQRARSKKFHLL